MELFLSNAGLSVAKGMLGMNTLLLITGLALLRVLQATT